MDAAGLPAVSSSNPQPPKPSTRLRWTPQEDATIREAFDKYGNDSNKAVLAEIGDLPGRTHSEILQRWRRVLNPELTKGPWTAEKTANSGGGRRNTQNPSGLNLCPAGLASNVANDGETNWVRKEESGPSKKTNN
jgi:hypothetical protein